MSINTYTRIPYAQRPALASLAEDAGAPKVSGGLHDIKPRRPRKNRRSVTWDPTLDIYDDTFAFKQPANAGEQLGLQSIPEPSIDLTVSDRRRSTLLAHPAQRLRLTSVSGTVVHDANTKKRRVSGFEGLSSRIQHVSQEKVAGAMHPEMTMEITKEPRRRTIYIPSDDTTIATIHPGAPSRALTAKSRRPRQSDLFLDLVALPEDEPLPNAQPTAFIPATDKLKNSKRSSLLVAPRRVPLQQSQRILQPAAITQDVMGSGYGKENVPPGVKDLEMKSANDLTLDLQDLTLAKSPKRLEAIKESPKRRLSFALGPASPLQTRSPNSRVVPVRHTEQKILPRSAEPQQIHQAPKRRESFIPHHSRRSSSLNRSALSSLSQSSSMASIPFKLCVPNLQGSINSSRNLYPILSEDISKPELYEENWLAHQEVALSECVNSLFQSAIRDNAATSGPPRDVRKLLTTLYHDSATALLHKRLQASLQFGALSLSKETLNQIGRYRDDLQQRQRFIDLWLKTYNLPSLQKAAEVVVGREVPQPVRLSGSPNQPAPSPRRKPLELFLKTFLIRNEDIQRTRCSPRRSSTFGNTCVLDDEVGSPAWMWRRTVVRSLMIILLLDKAQNAGHLTGCLFQNSSPFKSSNAVIQALGNLLLPSIGNIGRVLEHLCYTVSHVQYPLEEHTYHINNLALDLRDGVLLTRLVEVLLYPPSSLEVQQQNLTVTLPSGDMLTSSFNHVEGKDCWVLSQHLKYPCISRVQKMYNVEIALSALQGLKGTGSMFVDIKAEDIVDGHREKTVGLLWSLVSRWGLDALLDFGDVEREITRLRKSWRQRVVRPDSFNSKTFASDDEEQEELRYLTGIERQTLLLKTWARCASRLHGIDVKNLSTSFGGGAAYRAILAEYAACSRPKESKLVDDSIIKHSPSSSPSQSRMTLFKHTENDGRSSRSRDEACLTQQLLSIGCSRAFASLFTDTGIPSAQTTIPLLAFLASRLLPTARPHFAAIAIQRAWKRKEARFELTRRMKLKVLARECQVVVQQQKKIVDAATRIQKWWRALESHWTKPRELTAVVRKAQEQCL